MCIIIREMYRHFADNSRNRFRSKKLRMRFKRSLIKRRIFDTSLTVNTICHLILYLIIKEYLLDCIQ